MSGGDTPATAPELEPASRVAARSGDTVRREAAILGGGVIGGGWAARFLLNGWNVRVHDPDPEAARKIGAVLDNARASLPALQDVPLPPEGELKMVSSVSQAVDGADWIQENIPERLDLKHALIAQVQAVAPDVPLGSSTSGYRPSQLQEGAPNPRAIFVAHPFNPVYLLPLVEVVASPDNDPALIEAAKSTLSELGMHPLHVRKEIDAHIADRFLEAVWREALWLVKDGVATTEEIDDAIRLGFGLRWAQMGLFETYRIAGGEAGMRHFLDQFGPSLKAPWTRLMDVPDYDDALVELIAGQSDAQSGAHSIRGLERLRDDNLVGILRALKDRNFAAGKVLNHHDHRLRAAAAPSEPAQSAVTSGDAAAPLELAQMRVLPGWIDYNGHMTESRYLFAVSETVDAFLNLIGADLDYVATGFSYYSAETHLIHAGEAKAGDALTGSVQILAHDDKRVHVFVRILRDGEVLASAEQMLLHVDMGAGKACPAAPRILDRLAPLAAAHETLARPDAAGRHVGQGKTR